MDASTLEGIRRQLNMQSDMNAELMQQIHELETQHTNFQKLVSEKQAQLRQAITTADSLRNECNEWKRKHAIASVRIIKS